MNSLQGRWDFDRLGPPSLEAVRQLHQPATHFRVSLFRCQAGETFAGSMRAGRIYVIAGSCSFTHDQTTLGLQAGDIADLPIGDYTFCALGSGPVEYVMAWELPPEFWDAGI